MKYTTHMILAAAALAVAAGSASAQNLTAEIPLTFRAGGVVMSPGAYTVGISRNSGSTVFLIQNVDTRKSVLLVNYSPTDASKKWQADGRPKLGFECVGANCVLRSIWPATDRTSYTFHGPKPAGDEPTHFAEVRMAPHRTN